MGRKGGVDVGGGWVGWWVKAGENRRRSGGVRRWARGEAWGERSGVGGEAWKRNRVAGVGWGGYSIGGVWFVDEDLCGYHFEADAEGMGGFVPVGSE